MKLKRSFKLPKKLWAGFVSGKIDLEYFQNDDGGAYGILYTSWREAKKGTKMCAGWKLGK